jgi:transposase
LSTKLHALCDALGNPVAFHLTAGHLHDLHGADALLPKVVGRFGALLADRAYDAQERVIDVLNAGGVEIVIPSKINRTYRRKHDRALYAARHLIENFFAKLKAFRGISTRYDKRAHIFLGAIYLASAIISLK